MLMEQKVLDYLSNETDVRPVNTSDYFCAVSTSGSKFLLNKTRRGKISNWNKGSSKSLISDPDSGMLRALLITKENMDE
jgi:hypothetical protein